MKNSLLFIATTLVVFSAVAQPAQVSEEGFVEFENRTIYGLVTLDFKRNSVVVKKDGTVFSLGRVKRALINNTPRDEYHMLEYEGSLQLFKLAADGEIQLFERGEDFFSLRESQLTKVELEPKAILSLLRKNRKEVKNWTFVRDHSLTTRDGLIEAFKYYNMLIVHQRLLGSKKI